MLIIPTSMYRSFHHIQYFGTLQSSYSHIILTTKRFIKVFVTFINVTSNKGLHLHPPSITQQVLQQ